MAIANQQGARKELTEVLSPRYSFRFKTVEAHIDYCIENHGRS